MNPARGRRVLLRAGFVLGSLGLSILLKPFGLDLLPSALIAAFLAIAVLVLERGLRHVPLAMLIYYAVGLVLGLSLGVLITHVFEPLIPGALMPFVGLFCPFAASFLILSLGSERGAGIWFSSANNSPSAPSVAHWYLDSSALIDGRIADLAEAGFLHGIFVVPQFVLNELQTIADTADAVRRNRGRRGLEVAARLQKNPDIRVEISGADYRDIRQVDLKLIEAAKQRGARVVTTDFNLAKLAQVQGVGVLNLNEVAAALRPVVLQGETLQVAIAKEGKEPAQGLAYLEDGTAVVVENARRQIGKTIEVVVTGVVQSVSGKMIFARYQEGRSSIRNRNVS